MLPGNVSRERLLISFASFLVNSCFFICDSAQSFNHLNGFMFILGIDTKCWLPNSELHTMPSLQVVRVTAIYFQSTNFPPFALNWVRKETPWDEDKGEGHLQSICSSKIAEIWGSTWIIKTHFLIICNYIGWISVFRFFSCNFPAGLSLLVPSPRKAPRSLKLQEITQIFFLHFAYIFNFCTERKGPLKQSNILKWSSDERAC